MYVSVCQCMLVCVSVTCMFVHVSACVYVSVC